MANVVEILITAKNLTGPAMASVNAEVNKAGGGMRAFHKTAMIAGAGLAAIGVESVKMASKFDSSMTLLHTQAGVAQSKMAGLKQGVLELAGKVGQDPDSLSESLFHVESNFESMGISSKKALSLVETAAKGATTGHADLVDVTNALTAAVASGIPGVQNFDKAMGVLNATVGVGDMKMQDLASAFGSGMVATVKGFGLSIQDVGAALAVFGDNNIRGSLAGNQLRMSVMALGKPVSTATDTLQRLGLKTDTLAKDMQKGGLKLALEDLVDRMHKAGVSSKEQGQVITDAFGRKAGAGLNVLVSQMDRLESKYPALAEGANKFGAAWAGTQQTFAFQMKALQASFDALMITLGNKLIPPLQAFVSVLLAHKSATVAVVASLAGLAAAAVTVSVAMKAAAAATLLYNSAGRGVAALRGVFDTVALKAMYMREAFAAAGGGVAGLKAAFAELGAVGKASVVVAGVAVLALALERLSEVGKKAPPDVDRMTTALGRLGDTGKVSGEALRVYGSNLSGLADSLRTLARPSNLDKTQQFLTSLIGMDSTPVATAKTNLDAVDKALSNMVSGGKADLAKAAFDDIAHAMEKQGLTSKELRGKLDDYRAALAGQSLQEKLSAESMGVFGKAAIDTQKSMDAEAQSAKGLEESIMALNSAHRSAFDAETAFYEAISNATKAIRENGKTLDVHTDAGRKNRQVLSDLAGKTEDLADKKLKEKASWSEVDKVYAQGRKNLIATAEAMGDTKKQAEKLADTLLKAPKAQAMKLRVDDKTAVADLRAFNAAVRRAPGSKSVTLKTLSATAERVLEGFGFKVTHLKNGSVKISAVTGAALSAIRNVQGAVNALHGKKIGIGVYTTHYYKSVQQGGAHSGPQLPGMPGSATGGLLRRASGGPLQHFDRGGYISGPGSPTSDSIIASFASGAMSRVSDSEYVVQASAVRKYGVGLLDALNSGKLKLAGFARGGRVKMTQAQKDQLAARHQLDNELHISHFGKIAGYKRSSFEKSIGGPEDIKSLVSALNDAASKIKASFSGRTESSLLKRLDSVGKSLINYEKKLTSVTKSLDAAKDKLKSLKDSAAQLSASVKSGLLSSANITKGASSDQTVTLSSVKAGMVVSRDKVLAFANALKQLKAKGYSKNIIQQVAEAGVDGGGLETAGALLQASASEVASINSMQGQINSAASSAGKTTADAVYGKAIKDQTAVVKKLTKEQEKLQKAMASLAKTMEKLIQKAIGHKATGGIVGAAATGGIRGGLTLVGEHGPELAELPIGSRVLSNPDSLRRLTAAQAPWASMLNDPRRPANTTPAAGDGQPIVIQLRIGDREFGELWVDAGRRAVRARGSIEATLKPPRGR
ncbi:phage tail tape measure protein [Streptomyces sp. NPDC059597]|uniref:phage tail tape measure protein n=1 Tax=Streptomyces sp. NPDC059597 TaxID=3346879 RepID=UPI0036859E3A